MPRHHDAKPQPAGNIDMRGVEANEIVVVDEFPTGFAAGVEARLAARTLPMQREQAEAFDNAFRRRLAARREPDFEDGLAERQQFVREVRRRRCERGIRCYNHPLEPPRDVIEAHGPDVCHHPSPRARKRSEESERFSCTPSLRADRPSAMPRSWVK